jgi:hypothetical protein
MVYGWGKLEINNEFFANENEGVDFQCGVFGDIGS